MLDRGHAHMHAATVLLRYYGDQEQPGSRKHISITRSPYYFSFYIFEHTLLAKIIRDVIHC